MAQVLEGGDSALRPDLGSGSRDSSGSSAEEMSGYQALCCWPQSRGREGGVEQKPREGLCAPEVRGPGVVYHTTWLLTQTPYFTSSLLFLSKSPYFLITIITLDESLEGWYLQTWSEYFHLGAIEVLHGDAGWWLVSAYSGFIWDLKINLGSKQRHCVKVDSSPAREVRSLTL